MPLPPPEMPPWAAGRVGGGSGPAACPGAGSGWLSTRPDCGGELTDPVTSPADCGLEAKGLENGLSNRLVSELQPAALKATSANTMKEGRKDARNATGDGMVYPLILRRNGYD